jgi:hypothetical protein
MMDNTEPVTQADLQYLLELIDELKTTIEERE